MNQSRLMDWINQLNEVVIFYDMFGKIQDWNRKAQEVFGYAEEELKGRTILELFPKEYSLEGLRVTFLSIGNDKNTIGYRKNHTCFPCKIKNIEGTKEQPGGVILVQNLEEELGLRKLLDETRNKLEKVTRFRQDFIANMTHELRTPINGILGNVKVLEVIEKEQSEDEKETIHIIERCCHQMEQIINQVLDYAKLESGKMVLENQVIQVSQVIVRLQQLYIKRIQEKGLQFYLHVSDSVPQHVIGDTVRLEEVLCNLIDNAIKFTQRGSITLEITKVKEEKGTIELLFVVQDTGIGIAEEGREQLFQSFTQMDPSITRKYGGTGLGLSICKALIERMGGTIHVDSQIGRGSRFYFTAQFIQDSSMDNKEELNDVMKSDVRELSINEPVEQEDDSNQVDELLKRIKLCLEMESWDKAEEMVHQLKNNVKRYIPELEKIVFRMELAIRRHDQKKSEQYFNQIRDEKQKKGRV